MKTELLPGLENEKYHPQSAENIVKKHPFLEGMSPHQLRLLSDCAMRTHFSRDELIFQEGEMNGLMTVCHDARKGRYTGSH